MQGQKTPLLSAFTILGTLTAGMALVGCAVGPNADIQRARAAVTSAQHDPQVVTYAPAQLRDAEQTLNHAEVVWQDTGNRIEAANLAYIVEQQTNIAVAKAQENVTEAEAQRLADEREQIQLRGAQVAVERARQATRQAQEATARAQLAEGELAALRARDTDRGLVMTLPEDVLFDYNSAMLRPSAQHDLAPLMIFLREHPDRTVAIEGYTDNLGSESYNLDLSRARAGAVRNFLTLNGISSDRVIAYGYGEAYPVAANDSEVGRQQNRRVEVVISYPGAPLAVR